MDPIKEAKVMWWQEISGIMEIDVFDSVQDCIENAKKNYGISKGEYITVNELMPYHPYVSADTALYVLEILEDEAYENCEVFAENWTPSRIEQKEIDKLSDELTQCIRKWLKEHHEYPTFYKIENTREVMIE